MLSIQVFTFNPFQENSFVLYDLESRKCIIVDPGCSNSQEESQMDSFITDNNLVPTRLFNTHCHIDHVLGNKFIAEKYKLPLESHKLEIPVLQSCEQVGKMYGIPYKGSPDIMVFHEDGDIIKFGTTNIEILLAPGHSPGSICLHLRDQKEVIGGDVLFQGSIGRTDLPGGNHDTLINSIKTKLLPLDDDTVVYPGHGPSTTIGRERVSNPFL